MGYTGMKDISTALMDTAMRKGYRYDFLCQKFDKLIVYGYGAQDAADAVIRTAEKRGYLDNAMIEINDAICAAAERNGYTYEFLLDVTEELVEDGDTWEEAARHVIDVANERDF